MTTFSSRDIRNAILGLLALREHSRHEIIEKLLAKFEERHLIEAQLDDLCALGLQSDERFAEAFVRMRVRQGKGWLLIQNDLTSKGVSRELQGVVGASVGVNWRLHAREVRDRKFGSMAPTTPKEKAKQLRFLASRGFSAGEAYHAVNVNLGEDEL